jgi:serine/threonine protein phosphatase PrpC
MNSLVSLHSISNKIINQDYIQSVNNKKIGFEGFILADGLGSHFSAEKGASFCVEALKEILEKLESEDELDFTVIFKKVYQNLRHTFQTEIEENRIEDKRKAFGTTLISVLEYENKYVVAYLGNGSIWHLRGNFTHFSEQRYLPWSALNLLNPHTIEENGKEALYKFFAFESDEFQLQPSVIEISKDNNVFGDILIVSTDGLYSNDQISIAKDKEGGIWIAGEIKMEKLYKSLKSFLQKGNLNFKSLEKELQKFKTGILEDNLIDDDTTFGISISNTVIKYNKLK